MSKIQKNFRLDWIYFGGSPAEKPGQWRRGEISNYLGGNPGLVVRIIFERNDPVLDDGHATRLYDALRRAGYDVRLDFLSRGSTHFDILEVPGLGERVVRLVQEVVARTRRPAGA